MIPILFDPTAKEFSTNGIGRLSGAVRCTVTEELNGEYELALKYPINGELFPKIQNDSIIVAKPFFGGKRQAFRIYNIMADTSYMSNVYARHISYDASYIPIKPFTATGIADTIAKLNDTTSENKLNMENNPFYIDTDITNSTTVYSQMYHRSLRACLGGDEGSILDAFSGRGTGQYEWDNYVIHFWKHRGKDRGYRCRYGKNIVTLDRELDSSDLVTGVLGIWHDYDGTTYISGDIQYSDNRDSFKVVKTAVVDFSMDFEEQPTLDELNAAAKIYANAASIIKDSVELDFYDQDNQAVSLGDTISVKFDLLGVDVKLKVIKTVWDVLLDRYEKITVGSPRSTLDQTLAGQNSK